MRESVVAQHFLGLMHELKLVWINVSIGFVYKIWIDLLSVKKNNNEITVVLEKNKNSNECRPIGSLQQSESEVQVEQRRCTHEAVDQISRSSCFSSEVFGSASTSLSVIENEKPYHTRASDIQSNTLLQRTLSLRECWFSAYPWLHWDMKKYKLLCFYCKTFYNEKISLGEKKINQLLPETVILTRKSNPKIPNNLHQSSDMHCRQLKHFQRPTVVNLL